MNPYVTQRLAAIEQPVNAALAHRMLNLSCFLLMLTVVVGKTWDGWWHITYTFDGFWAPPHVFVYSMAALTGVVVAVMAFVPQIRQSLGIRFPALGLPFTLPGALFLMASGFVALGIAGVMLDNLWHSVFGLDETAWSAPHAMIGQSLAVISTGYIAARLALRPERPLRWYTTFWLALLLISFSVTTLGPLNEYPTLDVVRALRQIPILAAQPQAQHAYTILEFWNLTRSNLLSVPLTALAIGCALTLVQSLEPRRWRFVMIIAAWTVLVYSRQHSDARWLDQFAPTLANSANWLPLPLFPAACILAFGPRSGWRGVSRTLTAGFVFGLLMRLTWGTSDALVLAVVAAPFFLLGATIGKRVWRILEQPGELGAWILLFSLVVALPLATGAVDVFLRLHTPW